MGKKNRKKKYKINKNPFVSIVTPTFRRENFLPILFDNILKQEYPHNKMEWIIVDGENDENRFKNVPLVLNKLKSMNTDVKIVYCLHSMNKNNKIGGLRNKTNELAKGDIIVCMDDDDYYPPKRVINAIKSLKYGKYDLAGSSKMYMFDFDCDQLIMCKSFGSNHGTNNTFAYTNNYAKNNKYDETVPFGEEASFTNKFTNKMIQLDENTTVVQISHYSNTVNKKKMYEQAFYTKDPNSKYVRSSRNIFSFMDQEKYNSYLNVCLPYKRHEKVCEYDIVYYCGCLSNEWDPREKSLGGSEQAVIWLSSYWASQGYSVAVYGSLKEDVKLNNVDYFLATKFVASIKYNTLVLWRTFGFNGIIEWDLKADNIVLDLHDTDYPSKLENYLDQVDLIMVKSKFHGYSVYYNFSQKNKEKVQKKLRCLMNGVRVNNFLVNKNFKRNPYRLCYASCYTRGLERLVKYFFPVLKKLIPQAELHIYYGYPKPAKFLKFNAEMKKIIAETDGLYEYGRVGIDRIIEEKYKSNFHLYFTDCQAETDCISIRESLVTGCIPIISKKNVFYERDGLQFDLDINDPESYKIIAETVANYMKDGDKCEDLRKQLSKSETIKGWDQIADYWLILMGLKNDKANEINNKEKKNKTIKLDRMKNIKKTYVVNLEKRPQRLEDFYKKYPYRKDNVTEFKAVDGSKLDQNDEKVIKYVKKYYNIRKNQPYKGALGCSFSHEAIWKEIIDNEDLDRDDKVAVFEDDCFFTSAFNIIWEKISDKFPENTDFIYIGGRFRDKYLPKIPEIWTKVDSFIYKLKNNDKVDDRTTHAYVITKKGAMKLLQILEKEDGFDIELDKWLVDRMKHLNCYHVLPLLCWSPLDYQTDIQINKDSNRFNVELKS